MNYIGYIYKITNTINDKIYIGQTKKNIEYKWKTHCADSKGNSRLYNAINKYGSENFKIDIVEEISSISTDGLKFDLNEKKNIILNYSIVKIEI